MPRVEITEFICILNMVKYAILVDTFLGYSMKFPPTVRRTQIGSYFCGCTSTTMHVYRTVRPTVMLLHVTKRIMFVPLWDFSGDPSVGRPNSFDRIFF